MQPIIIGLNKDGKVELTLSEFRKMMDDAYWQGYRDNTSTSTITWGGSGKWWENQPYSNLCSDTNQASATNSTLNINVEG